MNHKEKIISAYKRFIREVESMSHFNHKNIVKFHQALRDAEGDLYIIMEHCDENLERKIKKDIYKEGGPIDESKLVEILRQIAKGINYLHGMNLSHRDISP